MATLLLHDCPVVMKFEWSSRIFFKQNHRLLYQVGKGRLGNTPAITTQHFLVLSVFCEHGFPLIGDLNAFSREIVKNVRAKVQSLNKQ